MGYTMSGCIFVASNVPRACDVSSGAPRPPSSWRARGRGEVGNSVWQNPQFSHTKHHAQTHNSLKLAHRYLSNCLKVVWKLSAYIIIRTREKSGKKQTSCHQNQERVTSAGKPDTTLEIARRRKSRGCRKIRERQIFHLFINLLPLLLLLLITM